MSTDARRRGMFPRDRRTAFMGHYAGLIADHRPVSPGWERASRIAALAMIALGWVCLWLAVTQTWPL